MASIIVKLNKKGLCKPPSFIVGGTHYETIMGSEAYGVAEDFSDKDIYGFVIPPKEYIFPQLAGKIPGFSTNINGFEQYQQHHIKDKDENKEYDLTIFNIVKYFRLCMENNPNVLDSLYTRENCVMHITPIGRMVKDNRKLFLSKKVWHSFRGYAYSQLNKLEIKNPEEGSKRKELVDKFGYDVKFAYHIVRLMNEVRQLMETGDMDLMKDNNILKSIRRGEWTKERIKEWFFEQEKQMDSLYKETSLPHSPNEEAITELLFNCLEEHYGDMSSVLTKPNEYKNAILEIKRITDKIKF